MYKKCIFIILFSFISLLADPLTYLNSLRSAAGLHPFNENNPLKSAAQNHTNYMQQNNVVGHTEVSSNSGYTGNSPSVRTQYTGYASLYVGENISYGTSTAEGSIDGLFAAIYHRFGFLNSSYDLIGIGNTANYYTYDLSNSQHNLLCQGDSYTGTQSYYTNACIDHNKRISLTDYTNASNYYKASAPKLIRWPPANYGNTPPVFYEESPDPLPNSSVSGYPVSVEFNDNKFSTAPTVSSFTLKDENNSSLNLLTTMQQNNDPANKFNAYQIAIFPKKRLEWGSRYYAHIIYDDNGTNHTESWCFSTKSLHAVATHYYRIENNTDIHLNVKSSQTYAIYVVPKDNNDILSSVSYSYSVSSVNFEYIDSNTVKIALDGAIGSYAIFTFSNGQKITLTIQENDTASTPKNNTCPVNVSPFNLALSINKTEIINSPTNIEMVLGIEKTDTTTQTQALVIRLADHNKMPLYFDANLQTLQGITLSNNQWELNQDALGYALTYIGNNGVFPANTHMYVGIEAVLTPPPHRKGSFTFTAQTPDGTDTIVPMQYSNLP